MSTPMRPAPAVLASLSQSLRAHVPFSAMADDEVLRIVAAAQLQ